MRSEATTVQDREADFEQAVLPETDRLFGLALAIVGDPGEAQDVVQETMISAWRAWRSLRDPGKLGSWLTRICINHSIHRGRLLHRRILWPSDRWAAEARLPDLDGLTVEECAAALGRRPGTARGHLGRGMAKLRRELQDA